MGSVFSRINPHHAAEAFREKRKDSGQSVNAAGDPHRVFRRERDVRRAVRVRAGFLQDDFNPVFPFVPQFQTGSGHGLDIRPETFECL